MFLMFFSVSMSRIMSKLHSTHASPRVLYMRDCLYIPAPFKWLYEGIKHALHRPSHRLRRRAGLTHVCAGDGNSSAEARSIPASWILIKLHTLLLRNLMNIQKPRPCYHNTSFAIAVRNYRRAPSETDWQLSVLKVEFKGYHYTRRYLPADLC